VEYDVTELDEVVLAYATTVHKSQGGEYPIVVAPLTMQHYMMLQRNLLYTCVTRAKKSIRAGRDQEGRRHCCLQRQDTAAEHLAG